MRRSTTTGQPATALIAWAALTTLALVAGCSSAGTDSSAATAASAVATDPPTASAAPPTATEAASTTATPVTTATPATTVAATTPPTTIPATPAPTTLPATTTTAAPPETTVAPTAADLVLRADGIGPASFGMAAGTVVALLGAVLGAPADQSDAHFPNAAGDHFEDADGNAFATEFARFTCFTNDLCVSFGGATADALTFAGWSYASSGDGPMPSPALSSVDGVRPGVTWSAVAAVVDVDDNGCYTTGYGDASGIHIVLQSPEAWFGSNGVSPTYVSVTPDPSTVTIIQLRAGEQSYSIYEDC